MSRAILKLEPRLDTARASALATAILDHAGADLELDASEVTHIGALGVQVIRAAAQSWKRSGHTLSLSGASADCADQIYLLGYSVDTICKWGDG